MVLVALFLLLGTMSLKFFSRETWLRRQQCHNAIQALYSAVTHCTKECTQYPVKKPMMNFLNSLENCKVILLSHSGSLKRQMMSC